MLRRLRGFGSRARGAQMDIIAFLTSSSSGETVETHLVDYTLGQALPARLIARVASIAEDFPYGTRIVLIAYDPWSGRSVSLLEYTLRPQG